MASSKTYLRYALERTTGVVCSPTAPCCVVSSGSAAGSSSSSSGGGATSTSGAAATTRRRGAAAANAATTTTAAAPASTLMVVAPAWTRVVVWDVRRGQVARVLSPRKGKEDVDGVVSSLAVGVPSAAPPGAPRLVAAGRQSGRVDVWDWDGAASDATAASNAAASEASASTGAPPRLSFAAHDGWVSCVAWSADLAQLCTGGRDTSIVLWDVVAEVGLFRLKGHKDEVTSVRFLPALSPGGGAASPGLVSASKDATLKVWDLEAQRCVTTSVDHASAVWALDVLRDRVVTGASDGLLRSFALDSGDKSLRVLPGPVGRQTSDRAETLGFAPEGDVLAVQAAGRVVEIYRVRSPDEAAKRRKRRLKRLREAGREAGSVDDAAWTQDELEFVIALRTPNRARSVSLGARRLAPDGRHHVRDVVVSFTNNLIQVYELSTPTPETLAAGEAVASGAGGLEGGDDDGARPAPGPGSSASKRVKAAATSSIVFRTALELQGHRSDVRSVALSGDDALVLTAAEGAVKVWNAETGACVRTMPSGFSMCCAFLPGDVRCVVGTREGALLVFDLASGTVRTEILDAHQGAVHSLDVRPDRAGIVTASADHTCKFWDVDLKAKRDLSHTRTLKLADDVSCVRYTRTRAADKLRVAVAMLDSTVKVFHDDSLEFSLSLYGHKLPVLCMDVSDDDQLLVTGSADKSIKIWGLDFGDCRRSLLAHEGSVTAVRFVPKTHYAFSAGRDGRVRYWDADHFAQILSLDGAHVGDAWGLAISSQSEFFVSVGRDKAVNVWRRTEEIVFPEEERERQLEKALNKEESDELRGRRAGELIPALASGGALGEDGEEVEAGGAVVAGARTAEGLDASERLVNVFEHEGATHGQLVATMRMLKAPELDEALLLLPFAHVEKALSLLCDALEARVEVELCARTALKLVKLHFPAVTASGGGYRELLERLNVATRQAVGELERLVGINAAGLRRLREV